MYIPIYVHCIFNTYILGHCFNIFLSFSSGLCSGEGAMAIGQLPYLYLTTRHITALSRAIIVYFCTNVTFFFILIQHTEKLQAMDKV
jgi:glycerol-3-phosphate acyltransferase PlsY